MTPSGATLAVGLSAVRHNYRLLQKKHARHNVAAVVKADAYGLGVGEVSRALWQEGCRDFFVATLEEAVELKEHLPQAAIAVFHGVEEGEENIFRRHDLTPVLNRPDQVERWQGVAPFSSAILHVDTGIMRLGLDGKDLARLAERYPQPAQRNFQLVMSHLACADTPGNPKNAEQLNRFKDALKLFPEAKASLVNSAGHFFAADYHFDLGRPGCALYGINPLEGDNPMKHVATLSAPILQIRRLTRDETVGYGATYAAKKGARIATVALGYADGLLRCLSNRGFAYVAGTKVPIAGCVSMDMITLDISAIPERKLSLELPAELINEKQTVSEVAALAGTIGYEIFTRLGKRVRRVYR